MASERVGFGPWETACDWRLRRRVGRRGALALLMVVLATVCTQLPARAGEPSTITLRDGSTVTGEIVSLTDGVYTIRSTTLGTLSVKAADVTSMRNEAAAQAPDQLGAIQEQIASDPDTMNAVSALKDAPELQAVLDDPEVMSALQSGNIEALLSNPNIARLAADPRIQEITKKFAH